MGKKQTYLLAGVVAILLIISLVISYIPEKPKNNEGESEFTIPEYVQMDNEDTFLGDVEIAGEWHGSITKEDKLTFNKDGTYTSSTSYTSGTYEQREGYIILKSEYETTVVLRVLMKEDGNIYLQQDMDSLPITFQRHEADDEPVSTDAPPVNEEILRFSLSTFQQVLEKSEWKSEDGNYDSVSFDGSVVTLTKGHKPVGEWNYTLKTASINEFDYSATMDVNGAEYRTKITWKGEYGEDGYCLLIDSLISAESDRPVELEQPT